MAMGPHAQREARDAKFSSLRVHEFRECALGADRSAGPSRWLSTPRNRSGSLRSATRRPIRILRIHRRRRIRKPGGEPFNMQAREPLSNESRRVSPSYGLTSPYSGDHLKQIEIDTRSDMTRNYMQRVSRRSRNAALGALSAACLFALMSATALAAPAVTDSFAGTASIPTGQTSPVSVDPSKVTVRGDGAIGLGYSYNATGRATGPLPGGFTYEEHGFLFFRNPADPTTMVGSEFSTGVFNLSPARGGDVVTIANTAPEQYSSGVQTGFAKLPPQVHSLVGGSASTGGGLTYGFFTFTNTYGTFTGYATPDFANFTIQVTFSAP